MSITDYAVREIGRDLRYYIPVRIVPAILHLIGIILYTRLLNPDEFGTYVLIIAAISLLTPLILGWLTQSNLRYYERNRLNGSLQSYMTTSLFAFFVSTALALFCWIAVGVLLRHIFGPHISYLFMVGAMTLVTRCGLSYVLSILRASRESRRYLAYVLVDAAGTLCVAYTLIALFGYGADAILVAAAIFAGMISFIEIFRYAKRYISDGREFSKETLHKIAKYGIPISAASIGSTTLMTADRFMIGFLIGAQAVGVYAAGYRISQMSIILISEVVMLAAYPVVIQAFEIFVESDTQKLLEDLVGIYVVILIPFVFILAIFSKDIAGLLLGPSYRDAYFIFPWIAAGAFCSGLTMYVSKPFELKERTRFLVYLIAVASGFNIIMNLLLIPVYGILGAAMASLLAYVVYLFLSWTVSLRLFAWKLPWPTFAKTLVAALVMTLIICYANRWNTGGIHVLLVKFLMAFSVYSGVLLLLRERYFILGFKYVKRIF